MLLFLLKEVCNYLSLLKFQVLRPAYQFLDSPNTTSQVIYKTQIARGANGGNRIVSDGENPGGMTLLEIAQ